MKVAIHQPHYFPWIGYLDKMAKADMFVLLDQVQFEKGSQMIRNRIIDTNGMPKYITISGDTSNFLKREYRELRTKDNDIWTRKHLDAIKNYYRKAFGFSEMMPIIEDYFSGSHDTICEWACASIKLLCRLFGIGTPLVFQSELSFDHNCMKSELVREICCAVGADTYLSGRGASADYLNRDSFKEKGISIEFQDFIHPTYSQVNTLSFVSGVSTLDFLFNCGIERAKDIFWNSVKTDAHNY